MLMVAHGRRHRLPGAGLGDGRVTAECKVDAKVPHGGEGVHLRRARTPKPLLIHPAWSAPEGVEHRLHTRHDTELRHLCQHLRRDHLAVLDAPWAHHTEVATAPRRPRLAPLPVSTRDRLHHICDRRVADGVDPCLNAEFKALPEVRDQVLSGHIARTGARAVTVVRRHVRGARSEGPVDEEVAGRAHGAESQSPIPRKQLPPVPDYLRQVRPGAEPQGAAQVGLTRDHRARVLMDADDAEAGEVLERSSLQRLALRLTEACEHRLPGDSMGRPGQEAVGPVALRPGQVRQGVHERA